MATKNTNAPTPAPSPAPSKVVVQPPRENVRGNRGTSNPNPDKKR